MNPLIAILGSIAALVGVPTAIQVSHFMLTKEYAFEEAQRLSGDKGIINIGAGPHQRFGAQAMATAPEVLANIDIDPDGLPYFIQLDVERDSLPFSDKQFGCAFASHVLEHLDDWQFCLSEASRVADYVVVVLPHPCSFGGWLHPDHKQHFSVNDIDAILQLYPNVVVYY